MIDDQLVEARRCASGRRSRRTRRRSRTESRRRTSSRSAPSAGRSPGRGPPPRSTGRLARCDRASGEGPPRRSTPCRRTCSSSPRTGRRGQDPVVLAADRQRQLRLHAGAAGASRHEAAHRPAPRTSRTGPCARPPPTPRLPASAWSKAEPPAPTASSTRPPEAWSSVVAARASTPGLRNVIGLTSVPIRARDVTCAIVARQLQPSCQGSR